MSPSTLLFMLLLLINVSVTKAFKRIPITDIVKKNPRRYVFSALNVVQGVGDEGCSLPSPSGINAQPIPIQTTVFFASSCAMILGAIALVGLFGSFESTFPEIYGNWKTSWFLLGPIFILAGVAHFQLEGDFENVYPRRGAWGIWYLPGTTFSFLLFNGPLFKIL